MKATLKQALSSVLGAALALQAPADALAQAVVRTNAEAPARPVFVAAPLGASLESAPSLAPFDAPGVAGTLDVGIGVSQAARLPEASATQAAPSVAPFVVPVPAGTDGASAVERIPEPSDPRRSPEAVRGGWLDRVPKYDAQDDDEPVVLRFNRLLRPAPLRKIRGSDFSAGAQGLKELYDGFPGLEPDEAQAVVRDTALKPVRWYHYLNPLLIRHAAPAAVSAAAFVPLAVTKPAPLAVALPGLAALGSAGYYVGNAAGFVYPLFQIRKAFEEGSAKAIPFWETLLGAGASLALAFNAIVMGRAFWGVQNLFGVLGMLAPIFIGKWLARRAPSRAPPSAAVAWLKAAAAALALLGLSVALYAGGAAVLVGALGPFFAAHAWIRLAIQIGAAALFFLMFLPPIVSVVRGRPPKGFTRFFSLAFSVGGFGMALWSLDKVLGAQGTEELAQFLIYAVSQTLLGVVSLISYFLVRKEEGALGPKNS